VTELSLKVAKISVETPDVKAFELHNSAGGDLPAFTAGSHIDVTVTLADGMTDTRSYSIASDPTDTSKYVLGILRELDGGGGSAFMHDKVSEGDILTASQPKNHFPLEPESEENLLIAGGIGITPILSMARELVNADRPFRMHYAAKSPEDMAFREDVESVTGEYGQLYFDGGNPANGMNLKLLLGHRRPGRHLFVCGPAGLIDAVRTQAQSMGWPENTIHYEVFKPAELDGEDQPVEVILAQSGDSHLVPADVSVLDYLHEQGVDIDYDCKIGICGLCATEVLEGEVDHRDHVLSEDERAEEKLFCPCISRAKGGPLKIDA